MQIIETTRLILRPWQDSDAESLYNYAKDPQVGPSAGWPVHESVENSREIIHSVLSAPNTFAVVLKETGEAIGSIGLMRGDDTALTDKDNECELGYWIGVPYWGLGLIPEAAEALIDYAFENLHMQAIWCGYFAHNKKSLRVQEKCGFVYHHTEHGKRFPLIDAIYDECVTLLTKDAWMNRNI